jgi:hypothetical protein
MAELLHEYWENEDGGEFGPVRERSDELRSRLTPGSKACFQSPRIIVATGDADA